MVINNMMVLQLDDKIRYYKPKRNDKRLVSVYNTPHEFNKHLEHDVYILLSKEIYHIGCSGNSKKKKGVSTCHAFLVGKRVKPLFTLDDALSLNFSKVKYDHINCIMYIENDTKDELSDGDICLITTSNEVYRVTKT